VSGPSSPRQTPSWRRRIVSVFTERLTLKAAAIFLAVVLWFVVNAKEPQIELVRVRFIASLDSSLVMRVPPPELQALIAGSPRELIKLTSNPPVVHRQITSDAPDTLVLDLRADDVVLPDGVDAVVRDVQPRSVTLRFESTWSRRVPVQSRIEMSPGDLAGPIAVRLEPESVQVSGPRHIVLRVPFVRTMLTTITLPDSLPHLVDLDTTQLGVRVRPSQVKVRVLPNGAPAAPATRNGAADGSLRKP
jgi:YbbR domain-containing protein